jgi:hypothetical protein
LKVLLRVAALLGTFYALVATSRPPCSSDTPDTQGYRVEGSCGPTTDIVITSDTNCRLFGDGGVDFYLPLFGEKPAPGPIRGQRFSLGGAVKLSDGGRVPLSDGGVRPAENAASTGLCLDGPCNVGNYIGCSGPVDDAGVHSFQCSSLGDLCDVTLTPIP